MEAQKQDNEHIFRSLYPSVPIPDKLTLVWIEFVFFSYKEKLFEYEYYLGLDSVCLTILMRIT